MNCTHFFRPNIIASIPVLSHSLLWKVPLLKPPLRDGYGAMTNHPSAIPHLIICRSYVIRETKQQQKIFMQCPSGWILHKLPWPYNQNSNSSASDPSGSLGRPV